MGTLLPNGTTWQENCANATGVNVFQIITFPTKEEAKRVQQSRDCVNYINQLNQEANTAIQCETTIGNQTIAFASLLTDLLKGKSSNKTKRIVHHQSMSGSMSGSVSLSTSDFSSDSTSSSGSTMSSLASDDEASRPYADDQEGSTSPSTSSASVFTATTFPFVAVAATILLAVAL
ncbi:elicitin-like protein [Plasmopara halstedii]|uniref:Elicitin n=1 Tax=Plasmopara halstedii TaxID=4781 RepID=A0A0P1AUV5_PLAHL|nr:elicitin-like protein [Plasmopara halstedii]CEG44317.1 elicitin-like protein [Plasmopara halstedii]|eukprot:XP_024580686.1 elicitin-like protein [Plasmopara halstedii]